MAFIEFQGHAHHGKTLDDNLDALERDETKQFACARTGVLYHAIPKKALNDLDAYLYGTFLPFLLDALDNRTMDGDAGGFMDADNATPTIRPMVGDHIPTPHRP